MKINQKDLVAGAFFILMAVIGLWLNLEHNMGTARRMGPGYMPWLTFWALIILAFLVIVNAFTGEAEKLTRWTGQEIWSVIAGVAVGFAVWWAARSLGGVFALGYNAVGFGLLAGFLVAAVAPGWRYLALICACMCVFALMLEKLGFFLALTGTIVMSCFAEREHLRKPAGILGTVVFLLVLCWFVFIYELDIRVNLWPQL
ncbi:MAG: hypothetical protein N2588_06890 [Rhodovarius sp.]|nr:hypothetical protein [Rhodovarius sp.]